MARDNRSTNDDAQAQEATDRGAVVARSPSFSIAANSYQTGDGNVLIAEANKGAAWVEAEPKDVVDTTEWL